MLVDKEVGSAGIARLAFRKIAAPEPEPAVIVGKMPEHHLRDEMMPLRFRRFARHIHRITISRSRAQAASLAPTHPGPSIARMTALRHCPIVPLTNDIRHGVDARYTHDP